MNLRTIQNVVWGGVLLGSALVACSSSVDSNTSDAGAQTATAATGTTTGAGGASTTGAGGDSPTGGGSTTTAGAGGSWGAGGAGGACSGPAPGYPAAAACAPADPSCFGQVARCNPLGDYAGASKFALRIAQLSLTAPSALVKGAVKGIIQQGITPDNEACHLQGAGYFSWLLAFDQAAGTLVTGGAKPPTDPVAGYSFVDEDVPTYAGTMHLGPTTLSAPIEQSCQFTSTEGSVNLPIYLDAQATAVIALPLQGLRFHEVTLSPNHDCIGEFNAATLEAGNSCLPNDAAGQQSFTDGGSVEAAIALEDADLVPVKALNQSLCVLLSGDSVAYGDGGSPNRCKRQNGEIVFQGDWCMATNQAATAACHDGMRFAGTFAASAVKVN